MAISGFNEKLFKVISDGDKIVLLWDDGKKRECYLYNNPLLTSFSMRMDRPMYTFKSFGEERDNIPGLPEYSVDLSFKGGECELIDHPLIMGVDIFDRLSINDYLDVINEKIKRRE